MDKQVILSHCDHTLLSKSATVAEIKNTIDDGIKFKTASVCIPPAFVKLAHDHAKGRVAICTVVGFPNGYSTTQSKVFETNDAIANGADEIDMVINLGELKSGNFDFVADEIAKVKSVCGNKILKVIVETCLLTDEEKIKMCKIVTATGADFIKTSTGFSKGGATKEDIILFSKHIGKDVKMKAAGGISSLQDAEDFINLGCARLGTSKVVNIIKAQENGGY